MKITDKQIIYFVILVIITIFFVLFIKKLFNIPRRKKWYEHFQKTKCYECEKLSCNKGHPSKCYDCEKQYGLGYIMDTPGGNPKLFAGR